MRRRTLLGAGFALGAPGLAYAQTEGAQGQPPLPPHLSALQPLSVTTPDDAPATLGAHVAHGPAVITFWATWCSPCLMEARHLSQLRRRVTPEQLAIVGINVDRNRDPERLERFMRRGVFGYTQLRGTAATYVAFGGAPGPLVLPRLFVFARDGQALAAFGRYDGASTLRAIDAAVEQALSG